MRTLLTGLVCALASMSIYARDTGYALQCRGIEDAHTQVISFLETDVDKRARYMETGSRTLWDSHEWHSDKFLVRSFMQRKGDEEPTLISFIEIQRGSLLAELTKLGDPIEVTTLRCERWSPQTRNK